MALWWLNRQQPKGEVPPDTAYTPTGVSPQADLAAFGPVLRQNHIAYVPAREFSGVPSVGTGNLAYVPDYLLSAPAWFAGNAALRVPNSIMIAQAPVMITQPKTVMEGIGGLTAGQIVHQPLLEVNILNNQSEVGQ
jgi:hypothetical protein